MRLVGKSSWRLAAGVAGCVAGLAAAAGTAGPATASGVSDPTNSPVLVFAWGVCDPGAGGWELTWGIVNLSATDATVETLSSELSEVRVGDSVPAYEWVTGRQIAPRGTTEASLDVTLSAPSDASATWSGTASIELGACFGPRGWRQLREKDDSSLPAASEAVVSHYSGCDGLALVAAGPHDGSSETRVTLTPSTGEVVEVHALAREPSDVVVFPADEDLAVEVAVDGSPLDMVSWENPEGCGGRPAPGVLIAIGAAALASVAVGSVLMVRGRRPERAR